MNMQPLTKADLAKAKNGLYEARECERECERCRACQIDVTEQEARAAHLKAFYQAILDNYPIQTLPATSTPN